MNVLAVISPGLKVLFERVGKSSPAITSAGRTAYGWPTPYTQDITLYDAFVW